MLNLARINKAAIRSAEVDASQIVREELRLLHQSNPDRRVELEIKDNVIVWGDKNLLQSVIQNLVNNAWKFTSTKDITQISFGTITQDGRQVCFIKDNGVGFDMKYYHKLFQPFQRLHGKDEFQGTGVGLASVKRIITKHNGDIRAESVIGKGTTFFFYLGT